MPIIYIPHHKKQNKTKQNKKTKNKKTKKQKNKKNPDKPLQSLFIMKIKYIQK